MISHHHKCIFIHIPKTAGQSIEHVFLNLLGLNWETRAPLLLRANDKKEIGPPRLAHLKAHEYVKFNYISDDLFHSYFKFSFVRNPWSRLVSIYNYRRCYQIHSFKSFVTRHLKSKIWKKEHWFVGPQYEFIYDKDENLLVDYIGKFENLQIDFEHVCKKINLEKIILPHINKSKKYNFLLQLLNRKHIKFKHYSEYYDNETKQVVADLYKEDIERFSYTFEYRNYK